MPTQTEANFFEKQDMDGNVKPWAAEYFRYPHGV